MEDIFRKTIHTRVYQDLADQIQQAILDGRLKAGDKLPSQRELGEMFQTSRASLREALRVLEQKGLIEVKLGVNGGARVKEVGAEQIAESLGLLIRLQKVSLDHLSEFREVVEGDVAALVAKKATPDDIQRLKELVAEADRCLKKGGSHWEDINRIDHQLHMTLAHITENPMYIFVLQSVHDNIHGYYEKFLPREEHVLKENYEDFCKIVLAVEKRQPDEARSLSLKHVRRFVRYMKRKEREEKKRDHSA